MKSYFKKKTWRSKKYLAFIRSKPCLVCSHKAIAHHIRIESNAGTSKKPGDYWSVPLCVVHHDEHDHLGRDSFWGKYDINIWRELFMLTKEWIKKE